MQYMSFDVSYFTTLPGIIATVGVVLLVGGLILFIVSGKKPKEKEEKKESAPEEKPVAAEPEAAASVEPITVSTTEPVSATPAEPVSVEAPAVNPDVVVPQIDVPAQTEPEKVESPAPVVEEKKEEVPATDNGVSIYGGASPQVTVTQDEEPRKVYGGADPLENTGALPRVETPAVEVAPVEAPKVETAPVTESVPAVEVPSEVKVQEPSVDTQVAASTTNDDKPVSAATPNTDVETLEF